MKKIGKILVGIPIAFIALSMGTILLYSNNEAFKDFLDGKVAKLETDKTENVRTNIVSDKTGSSENIERYNLDRDNQPEEYIEVSENDEDVIGQEDYFEPEEYDEQGDVKVALHGVVGYDGFDFMIQGFYIGMDFDEAMREVFYLNNIDEEPQTYYGGNIGYATKQSGDFRDGNDIIPVGNQTVLDASCQLELDFDTDLEPEIPYPNTPKLEGVSYYFNFRNDVTIGKDEAYAMLVEAFGSPITYFEYMNQFADAVGGIDGWVEQTEQNDPFEVEEGRYMYIWDRENDSLMVGFIYDEDVGYYLRTLRLVSHRKMMKNAEAEKYFGDNDKYDELVKKYYSDYMY